MTKCVCPPRQLELNLCLALVLFPLLAHSKLVVSSAALGKAEIISQIFRDEISECSSTSCRGTEIILSCTIHDFFFFLIIRILVVLSGVCSSVQESSIHPVCLDNNKRMNASYEKHTILTQYAFLSMFLSYLYFHKRTEKESVWTHQCNFFLLNVLLEYHPTAERENLKFSFCSDDTWYCTAADIIEILSLGGGGSGGNSVDVVKRGAHATEHGKQSLITGGNYYIYCKT